MIDMYFSQTKSKTNNDIAVLGGLALVIVMEDFYQFLLITGQSLQTDPITEKEIYGKSI